MKILIVGGGVAGPALARFMKGHAEITLIDKALAWGNIGYAITLWSNGQEVIRKLGIYSQVFKDAYEVPWSSFGNKKGKLLKAFLLEDYLGRTSVVTRSALQQNLVHGLEKFVQVRMGTTISDLKNEEGVVSVTFSDGTSEIFDLVVGADGVHSQVRELAFEGDFLKYYGWKVYGFWSPKAPPLGLIEFTSGGKMCFIYPLKEKAVVGLFVADPQHFVDKNEDHRAFLHEAFSEFKESVGHIIDAVEDPSHMFVDNLMYVRMKDWYRGRVVLMGDAQHATSPLTGMGSSMALEDAYVLSEELKKNSNNINFALAAYAKRREKRVRKFLKASDFIELWLAIRSPFISFLRDFFMRLVPVSYFTSPIRKILQQEP